MDPRNIFPTVVPSGTIKSSGAHGALRNSSGQNFGPSPVGLALGSGDRLFPAPVTRIDRPLHMLPHSLTFPSQEKVGALVEAFWIYRAPIYLFVHPLTFANQVGRNPMVLASICLAAFPWINDPAILQDSIALQERFLHQAITAIKAVLDAHLPDTYEFTRPGLDKEATIDIDEKLDHLCESVFAICMLSSWAAYRGLSTLNTQLSEIGLRLAVAIGLHRDPPSDERRKYSGTDPLTIYLRKIQRRSLWFVVSFSVLFSSHWKRRDISESVIHYGEDRLFPLGEAISFRVRSLQPNFDPSVYYPENRPDPDLKRSLRVDDLLSFAHFPAGSAERQLRLRVTARVLADDETYSWATNFIYWNLRVQVNRLIRDCLDAGTTPAEIAKLDTATAPDGALKLNARAKKLDSTIVDLLDNLIPTMKETEASGNYHGLMEHFRPSEPILDESGAAGHAKTQYLIAIRLLRLEVLSNFGVHTFDKIANGALDSEFTSPRFWECLSDAVVYARHMHNLLQHNHVVRHLNVGTGPTVTKVNLAVLAFLLRDTGSVSDAQLLLGLLRDVETSNDLLAAFARGRPAQSVSWVTSVATVFGKLLGALKQTPNYKFYFGTDPVSAFDELAEGLTLVEIEEANLQRDVATTPGEDEG